MMTTKKETKEKTRQSIIDHLKRNGGTDAKALAESFGLTPMAIRLHLYDLRDRGLVAAEEESRGVGRPTKVWKLTADADSFFPDGHADLLVDVLDLISEKFGPEAMNTIAFERGEKQLQRYVAELDGVKQLKAKLDRLAKMRSLEGYMATVEKDAKTGDWLLIENNCPICAAATKCSGLCASELDVFQRALGSDFIVERTDHILAGARRCAYRVTLTA